MEFTRVFATLIDTEQVNQTELARSLNVSKQAITNLKKAPVTLLWNYCVPSPNTLMSLQTISWDSRMNSEIK